MKKKRKKKRKQPKSEKGMEALKRRGLQQSRKTPYL